MTPIEFFRMLQEIGILVAIIAGVYVVYKLAVLIDTLITKIRTSS